jgi:TRAP-type C4-dicarboxylate transport system substrate-binding protein
VVETDQPWISVVIVLSKKWLDGLPADLRKIICDDAASVTTRIAPFTSDFFAAQRTRWTASGGELISLPADEKEVMIEKISSIGSDLSQSKPELNQVIKAVFAAVARNK